MKHAETVRLKLFPSKETQSDYDEGSVNDTCNSDNKSDPPFYPINILVVKSRIGRSIKGINKPFWKFSKSKCPLSLKKIKRKCEDNETSEKIQRTNDVITYCSQSGFIIIDNDNEFEADTITNNSWIKFDTVSLDVNSKVQIEGGEMLDNRTIEACQTIFYSQFPGINGFQETVLGQLQGDIPLSFMPIAKDMLQILFKGDNKCGHALVYYINIKFEARICEHL